MRQSVEQRKAKAYLANQFGFYDEGRDLVLPYIKQRMEEIGIQVLEPFEECKKQLLLPPKRLSKSYDAREYYYAQRNHQIAAINRDCMRQADLLTPLLDGGHTLDEGVVDEMAFYAGLHKGPIIAHRSDSRLCENMAGRINSMVEETILSSGGVLVVGEHSLEEWLNVIRFWYERFFRQSHF